MRLAFARATNGRPGAGTRKGVLRDVTASDVEACMVKVCVNQTCIGRVWINPVLKDRFFARSHRIAGGRQMEQGTCALVRAFVGG